MGGGIITTITTNIAQHKTIHYIPSYKKRWSYTNMATYYHASCNWIEEPNAAFIQSGEGHSAGGLGLYLTKDKEFAKEFIENTMKDPLGRNADAKGAAIYTTEIDDKTIYHPYKNDPTEFHRILDAASVVMGEPIHFRAGLRDSTTTPENQYNAQRFMDMYIPDQQVQNDIYAKAGYTGHISTDGHTLCLTDTTAFPKKWAIDSIIGAGPNHMPSHAKAGHATISNDARGANERIANQQYGSETLSIFAPKLDRSSPTTSPQTQQIFKKAIVTLLQAHHFTNNGSTIQDHAFVARDTLGQLIQQPDTQKAENFAQSLKNTGYPHADQWQPIMQQLAQSIKEDNLRQAHITHTQQSINGPTLKDTNPYIHLHDETGPLAKAIERINASGNEQARLYAYRTMETAYNNEQYGKPHGCKRSINDPNVQKLLGEHWNDLMDGKPGRPFIALSLPGGKSMEKQIQSSAEIIRTYERQHTTNKQKTHDER